MTFAPSRISDAGSWHFLSCIKRVKDPIEAQDRWISLTTPQRKRTSSHMEGRISWFFLSCSRKLGLPLNLQRVSQGPAHVASGMSSLHASREGPLGIPLQPVLGPRTSSGAEARASGILSSANMYLGFLWSFDRGVRPRLVWRHASTLPPRAVTVVPGFLSS